MSVIVGAIIGKSAYLAADCQAGGLVEPVSKITLFKNYGIAIAGFLTFQRAIIEALEVYGEISEEAHIKDLGIVIKDAIKEIGTVYETPPGEPPYANFAAIIATTFGLYEVFGTGIVIKHHRYATAGSGETAAFGVLFGARNSISIATLESSIVAAALAHPESCGKGLDIACIRQKRTFFLNQTQPNIAYMTPRAIVL